MKQLIIVQGLPGSGKTTWALAKIKALDPMDARIPYDPEVLKTWPRVVRVNQDDIRKELGWQGWSTWDFRGDAEAMVTPIKYQRIEEALRDHENVIVISDDTNLNPKVLKELKAICERLRGFCEVHKMDTSPTECVRRDALREASVGAKIIYDMADKYRLTENSEYQTRFAPVTEKDRQHKDGTPLAKAIICDLDGTLSLFMNKGHRGPYDASLCDQDDVNVQVLKVLRTMERALDYQVIYVSGRYEQFRPQTMTFFKNHYCPVGPLHMRKDGDSRKDWIVKGEIFDTHIRGRYDVRLVLDDRTQVVNFWRSIGLECWQVAKGDF